ncbi:hypothetical protein Tdes44962_MAKER03036 [Teratosphaeria destructans]|uniref:Uncharacterized protein n=1 Tax=Teratosphaeria destructans TaxID=418781 RepID=A0A9W7SR76_9PEZI|nr:hypothetical protein Tdes44962_MAKER03036 [Teratosphaeria destructans]
MLNEEPAPSSSEQASSRINFQLSQPSTYHEGQKSRTEQRPQSSKAKKTAATSSGTAGSIEVCSNTRRKQVEFPVSTAEDRQCPKGSQGSKRRRLDDGCNQPHKRQFLEDAGVGGTAVRLVDGILEGAENFQRNDGAQVDWTKTIELLRPKPGVVNLEAQATEHEKYANAATTRSWQATFLASCAVLLLGKGTWYAQTEQTHQ